ncbi:MAG: MBL fold metallo-hydrolase [Hyphomonadaceae bacterium]
MKAFVLFLSLMVCAACSTPAPADAPLSRYGGPPLADPVDFDRASIDVIRGTFAAGRQPDGNTVILSSADGLIVFDTGRHAAHTQKIVDIAHARGQQIAAIINSHWHLDHISGNIALRRLWPGAAVYSNEAALTEALGSFLKRGLEANRKMLADPATTGGLAEDLRADIATVEQGDRLHPTTSIAAARDITIGGRTLQLHAANATSAGDVWLYDPISKLVATGDLVTLPAPFLDTACPAMWRLALDNVLATPFDRAIPGHGREMTRADVTLYRDAFNALLDCAAAAPLLDDQSGDAGQAVAYAGYYVENILRAGKTRTDCTS